MIGPLDTAETAASCTASAENYLRAIYELAAGTEAASTSAIAARLNVSPASVSDMLHRLADQGLVDHAPYRGARLTAYGECIAVRTLRRQRIIETYLARTFSYPWDAIAAETERLEHVVSDRLVDRMATALHDPRVTPYGAPIPTRDGRFEPASPISLAELAPGVEGRVVRVRDDDAARLRALAQMGVVLGATVRIVDHAPFARPITIGVGSTTYLISPVLASTVYVELPAERPRAQ